MDRQNEYSPQTSFLVRRGDLSDPIASQALEEPGHYQTEDLKIINGTTPTMRWVTLKNEDQQGLSWSSQSSTKAYKIRQVWIALEVRTTHNERETKA